MAIRIRNGALLAAIESVAGTPETLSGATDAIRVANPLVTLTPQNVETNEVTASLDAGTPITGGMQGTVTCDVYLKGSGTAGVAPQWGTLLQACGYSETLTATQVPAGGAEAATAGTATTVTADTGFTATAQLYRGMPVNLAGNPAAGALTFISDYTSGRVMTLTDTFSPVLSTSTTLLIPANVLYKPISDSIPYLTIGVYYDGVYYTLTGCQGNASLTWTAAQGILASFTFQGTFYEHDDDTLPTCTYDATTPIIWRDPDNDASGACLVDRQALAVSSLTMDTGNTIFNPENPNATQGYDIGVITGRATTLSFDPLKDLVATRDAVGAMVAGSTVITHARAGTVAGNRIAMTAPAAMYTGAAPSDRSGLLSESTTQRTTGQGNDGLFICVY